MDITPLGCKKLWDKECKTVVYDINTCNYDWSPDNRRGKLRRIEACFAHLAADPQCLRESALVGLGVVKCTVNTMP
jgi:hypothetical protein